MSIKLIAFDVDGTFVGDDHLKINEKNIEAMKMAHEQGIKVVMSTGRTQSISQKEIDDVGCVDYMVLSNGAIVSGVKPILVDILKEGGIPSLAHLL